MIRQLGNPTWFCSFSAAETRWVHLLKILGRLVENKEYSDSDSASDCTNRGGGLLKLILHVLHESFICLLIFSQRIQSGVSG